MILYIPQQIIDQIVAHLTAVYPEEGCGLLSGSEGIISRHYPIENSLHSPVAYEMNPKAQIMAFIDAESRDEQMLAIYHSHPTGPERPSPTDIDQATYPELVYLICSLKNKETPIIRGFTIVEQIVTDIPLCIL